MINNALHVKTRKVLNIILSTTKYFEGDYAVATEVELLSNPWAAEFWNIHRTSNVLDSKAKNRFE